jgi:hypothetical protein
MVTGAAPDLGKRVDPSNASHSLDHMRSELPSHAAIVAGRTAHKLRSAGEIRRAGKSAESEVRVFRPAQH